MQGGAAFACSVYLNGGLVGNLRGALYTDSANMTLSFANATLHSSSNGSNVLTVIQDMTGKDMRAQAVTPRGIINATLIDYAAQKASNSTNFSSWKVAGTAGHGSHAQNFLLDPVRGTNSEGDFHHERLGWHLPGFEPADDGSWTGSKSSSTLTVPSYGIQYFLTTFPLDIPARVDASLAFPPCTLRLYQGLSCMAVHQQLPVRTYVFADREPDSVPGAAGHT